jgi:hypothetical protein
MIMNEAKYSRTFQIAEKYRYSEFDSAERAATARAAVYAIGAGSM